MRKLIFNVELDYLFNIPIEFQGTSDRFEVWEEVAMIATETV